MHASVHIFWVFTRLGLLSFGGPIAHLGYFRREFVVRRQWLNDAQYADIVALCHFLPGPTSSQTGFALGLRRGGLPGGIAAWLGFTLPSAIMMGIAGALLVAKVEFMPGWLLGLKALAVGVVAHALYGMTRTLASTIGRATLALLVAAMLLAAGHWQWWPGVQVWMQPTAIGAGALVGILLFKERVEPDLPRDSPDTCPISRRMSAIALALVVGLLVCAWAIPIATSAVGATAATYRAGAMVFGGGHVVLPLLQVPFIANDWLTESTVLAGYALAQCVPGPLFTMASFLGSAMAANASAPPIQGLASSAMLTIAVFLPGLLIVIAALPVWHALRRLKTARAAVVGANAAVVGVLGAAFAQPIIPAGVRDGTSLLIAMGCTALMFVPRMPLVVVVATAAAAGHVLLGH